MSYSREIPCGNCNKKSICNDGRIVESAIYLIYDTAGSVGHEGYGTITLSCDGIDPINQPAG